jgi:hypothetical protein
MICDTARTEPPHQIIVAWPKSCRDFPVDEINAERRSSQPKKLGAEKGRGNGTRRPLSAASRKSVRQSGRLLPFVDTDERGGRYVVSACLVFDVIAQWVFAGAYLVDGLRQESKVIVVRPVAA